MNLGGEEVVEDQAQANVPSVSLEMFNELKSRYDEMEDLTRKTHLSSELEKHSKPGIKRAIGESYQ